MRNTLIAIVLLFVFCVLYNLPRWFEIESYRSHSPKTNRTFYQAKMTSFGMNSLYNEIMRKYAYLIFVYGVPFLVLLIVNIGIIRKLIEAKRRKHKLMGGNNQKKTNNNASHQQQSNSPGVKLDPMVTLMVLCVVLAFFCSQFPYLIINLLAKSSSSKLWFHIAKCLCDFLAALNYCINFIIYCFFGQKFREVAKQILLNPSLTPYKQSRSQNHQNRAAKSSTGGNIITKISKIRNKPLETIDNKNKMNPKPSKAIILDCDSNIELNVIGQPLLEVSDGNNIIYKI
jgi:hypothetical protein